MSIGMAITFIIYVVSIITLFIMFDRRIIANRTYITRTNYRVYELETAVKTTPTFGNECWNRLEFLTGKVSKNSKEIENIKKILDAQINKNGDTEFIRYMGKTFRIMDRQLTDGWNESVQLNICGVEVLAND